MVSRKTTGLDLLSRLTNQIIAGDRLSPRDVTAQALARSTLYVKLISVVQPWVEKLSLTDAAIIANAGIGVEKNLLAAYLRGDREPPVGGRTYLIEAHGWSVDWISPHLDGRAYIYFIACTAVCARIFDLLPKTNRRVLAPIARHRPSAAPAN